MPEKPVGSQPLAALHELAVAASGLLEPSALAKMAVDLACNLLGVDSAALYWWASTDGLLHSLADNRAYQAPGARTLEPGKGVAGIAFQKAGPCRRTAFTATACTHLTASSTATVTACTCKTSTASPRATRRISRTTGITATPSGSSTSWTSDRVHSFPTPSVASSRSWSTTCT